MSTNKPPAANRPLSPFMIGPYYRPQLTSMLSITHRMTGLFLTLGSLFIAAWLIALASGPQVYGNFARHMLAWYGQILLFAWSFSALYHLCNGIRHLVWDTGRGLDIRSAYAGGYAVIAASTVLTIAIWVLAYAK